MLCLSVIKHGKKVVCGQQDGVLGVFSWGDWGDIRCLHVFVCASLFFLCVNKYFLNSVYRCLKPFPKTSDRFPGHPNSVDSIIKVDEDTILTGSLDGIVRFKT